MASGAGSFPKTVGSNSSDVDAFYKRRHVGAKRPLPATGFCLLLPDYLEFSVEGTGPTGDEVEGASDVTTGVAEIKKELSTIVSGVYKTVTPGTDAAEGTGGGRDMLSTTPPTPYLELWNVGKIKTRHN
ncbi:hypothetical protein Fot_42204 [Forsythia ovata]|uniref:Uncharacterized protein n=1 Tax=Forsythia ovata TaxID=205694 RepID=A0ABD1RKL2_9LAMI